MRLRVAAVALAISSSPAIGQSALTGYVRDETTLRPLQGAEIVLSGVDKRVRSDKDGKYAVRDLTPGPHRVQVRLVGYTPVDTTLEFGERQTLENVFFLTKPPVVLDSVVSKGRNRAPGAGFDSFGDRKARGFGAFLDSTVLRANEHRHLPDLLMSLRGIDVMTPTTCKGARPALCNWRVAAKRGPTQAFCSAQLVMDGSVLQRSEMIDDRDAPPFSPDQVVRAYAENKENAWRKLFDLNSISVASLIGVEVYRSGAEAPDVFGGAETSCGVVVLWTHR